MNFAADYRNEFSTARRAYEAKRQQIRALADPTLSEVGLAAEKTRQHEQNRATLGNAVRTLRSKATSLREQLQAAADRVTPEAPASTHDAWIRAEMLLNAGRHLHQVIQVADAKMLHAITEFGPTYLEAQQPAPTFGEAVTSSFKPVDLTGFHRSIAKRWAQLDPKTTAAFEEQLENFPDLAALDFELTNAESVALGTTHAEFGMTDAIGADMAKSAASLTLEHGA